MQDQRRAARGEFKIHSIHTAKRLKAQDITIVSDGGAQIFHIDKYPSGLEK
jgi:hypothetical protein